MIKILEITCCHDCGNCDQELGDCFLLNRRIDLNSIPDDCPLPTKEQYVESNFNIDGG